MEGIDAREIANEQQRRARRPELRRGWLDGDAAPAAAPVRSSDDGRRKGSGSGSGQQRQRHGEGRGATAQWRVAGPIDPRRDITIMELLSRF
ncbi:hypothetical protein Scep_016521 [Stephania cephalantha]|uniref:Uncharacterized protein n=1 Tax=Stephania cephalantha TaxID=152367 RepID=A0AAP0IP16_9MAGN